MPSKPVIERLADRLIEHKGIDYQRSRQALTSYLKELKIDTFRSEVARIDNPEVFPYMMAAGLSSEQQTIMTIRWNELTA